MEPIPPPFKKVILICVNERPSGKTACGNRDSFALFESLMRTVRERGLDREIRVTRTRCLGLCESGPNVAVYPEGVWYSDVRDEDLREILDRHVAPGVSTPTVRGDRVGLAVGDLEEAKRFFQEVLGARFRPEEQVPDQAFRYAPFEVGGFTLELLSPTPGDGVIRRFLQKRGDGVYHLSFRVDNLDEMVRHLEGKGLKIAARIDYPEGVFFEGYRWREAFLHPRETFGVLIHFAEVREAGTGPGMD